MKTEKEIQNELVEQFKLLEKVTANLTSDSKWAEIVIAKRMVGYVDALLWVLK